MKNLIMYNLPFTKYNLMLSPKNSTLYMLNCKWLYFSLFILLFFIYYSSITYVLLSGNSSFIPSGFSLKIPKMLLPLPLMQA